MAPRYLTVFVLVVTQGVRASAAKVRLSSVFAPLLRRVISTARQSPQRGGFCGEAASWLFSSRRQALTLLEHCTAAVSAA